MLGLDQGGEEVDIGTCMSQRHSPGGLKGNGGEDVTNTKPLAQGQSKGACGLDMTSNDVNTKPLAQGQSKGACGKVEDLNKSLALKQGGVGLGEIPLSWGKPRPGSGLGHRSSCFYTWTSAPQQYGRNSTEW